MFEGALALMVDPAGLPSVDFCDKPKATFIGACPCNLLPSGKPPKLFGRFASALLLQFHRDFGPLARRAQIAAAFDAFHHFRAVERAAGRAAAKAWRIGLLAQPPRPGVQSPRAGRVGQAVARRIASKVQNQSAIFPGRGAKGAADLLKVQSKALRRPEQDRRADRGDVDALAYQTAIRDDVEPAVAERGDGRPSLRRRRPPVDMHGANASVAESFGNGLGVRDVDAKGDSRDAGA
ncbi:MAG: hypothetical protein ABSC25_00835 [Roseiarcus sp.]